MPTNEQRRATAKRKLERQLERRAQQARRRRTLAIVGGSVAAAIVVAAIVVTVVVTNKDHNNKQASATGSSSTTATSGPVSGPPLPAFKPTADLGANCQYPPSPEPAAKQVNPPRQGKVPTDPAQVSVSMVTNQGHYRPAAREQRITLHRQQFRQSGAAEVLRRHQMPPADHRGLIVDPAVR